MATALNQPCEYGLGAATSGLPVTCVQDPRFTVTPWGVERELRLSNGQTLNVVKLRPGVTPDAVPLRRTTTSYSEQSTAWNRLRAWLLA